MVFSCKNFFVVLSFLILAVPIVSAELDKRIIGFSGVSFNGVDLSDSVKFSVEPGSKLDVLMSVVSSSDVERLEFQASISGYSLNDLSGKRLFSSKSLSNIRSGIFYPLSFSFDIPEGVDVGDYSVSVSVWDRSGFLFSEDFPFVVRAGDHDIVIKELLLSGGVSVVAGDIVVARARVENAGFNDEDVRLEFSIPSVGISDVLFIDDLKSGDIVTSSDSIINVPDCVASGDYVISLVASFRDGRQSVSKSVPLTITGGMDCSDTDVSIAGTNIAGTNIDSSNLGFPILNPNSRISVSLPNDVGEVVSGEEFSFSARISNNGGVGDSFKLDIVGEDSIGEISVSPSVIVIPLRSSESVRVEGVVGDDNFGERFFFLKVSSIDDSYSFSVPVSVDIVRSPWSSVRSFLEVVIIILVVVLLGVVFFVAWRNDWF